MDEDNFATAFRIVFKNEISILVSFQESLHAIQSERTLVQLKISNIRSELTNLQTDLQEHRRGEPKYLTLMKKEFEVTQEKNKLEEHYEILDKKEREMFSHLQSKINMLHDKSRTHTRQWGIISTVISRRRLSKWKFKEISFQVIGAVLGIVGTSISAYFRNNDIRNIQKSMQEQFQLQVDQITKEMQQVNEGYNAVITSMERFEVMLKSQRSKVEKPRSSESWTGFFRRKSVSVWRWCTFQNSS